MSLYGFNIDEKGSEMTNPFKEFWKRDPALDHHIKYEDISLYTCMEISDQIFKAKKADSRANLVLILASILAVVFWQTSPWFSIIVLVWPIAFKVKVRKRMRVSIVYELDERLSNLPSVMVAPFADIAQCEKIIEVTSSELHEEVSAKTEVQFPVQTNFQSVVIRVSEATIFALADCAYVMSSRGCWPVLYSQIKWTVSAMKIIEESPPSDAEVVGERWQHARNDGRPDMRYKENSKKYVCKYGKVNILFGDALSTTLLISNLDAAKKIRDIGSSCMTVGGFQPHKFAWLLFYGLLSRSSGPRNFD